MNIIQFNKILMLLRKSWLISIVVALCLIGTTFSEIVPSDQANPPKGVQILSKMDYLRDKNFNEINEMLRKYWQLTHYNVIKVTRNIIKEGHIYSITYDGPQMSIIFNFSRNTTGHMSIVRLQVDHPETLTTAQYKTDKDFILVDKKLRAQNSLANFYVVQAQKRQDYAKYFEITYINSLDDIFIFSVTIEKDGVISVTRIQTPDKDPNWIIDVFATNLDQLIRNSKGFKACFNALVQSNPIYASAILEAIGNFRQTIATKLTTYNIVFKTKSGKFSAVLTYNHATSEANVVSVLPSSS